MRNLFIGLFLITTFCTCQPDKGSVNKNVEPTLALLYCDMSKSGNKDVADQVHRKIMNVYDFLPHEAEIEIHALNYPGGSKLLLKITKPNEKPQRDVPSENEKHDRLLGVYRNAINSNVLDTLQSTYNLDDGKRNSCILNVLESANDIFISKDTSWRKELYIFSDFIEDCSNSINGQYLSIYDDRRLSSTLRELDNWSPNMYDPGVKVKFIYTDNTDVNRKISYDKLKEFWNIVFSRVNNNDSLYFSSRIGN